MGTDWKAIAGRIKGLISMSDRAEIASAAARLGVEQSTLHEALRFDSPSSSLKVISALVRVYGLDPTWVMTGIYDALTHRAAMNGDPEEIDALLGKLLAQTRTRRGAEAVVR